MTILVGRPFTFRHGTYSSCGFIQHSSQNTVDPQYIGNTVHHGDVFGSNYMGHVSGGNSGQHDFGDSKWQHTHNSSAQICAGTTACRNNTRYFTLVIKCFYNFFAFFSHGLNHLISILPILQQALFFHSIEKIDIYGTGRGFFGPDINGKRTRTFLFYTFFKKKMLFSLGVKSSKYYY